MILTFAVPLFIGNIFQQVYAMVDTMVAGYCLGDQAIAAIGATSSLYGLIIDLAWGLNSGFALIVTQAFGAHEQGKIRKCIGHMMVLDGMPHWGTALLRASLRLRSPRSAPSVSAFTPERIATASGSPDPEPPLPPSTRATIRWARSFNRGGCVAALHIDPPPKRLEKEPDQILCFHDGSVTICSGFYHD